MSEAINKYGKAVVVVFVLTISCFVSGCAPLLIGAGAVGGYEVAKHN
jgi:hypothetical protein